MAVYDFRGETKQRPNGRWYAEIIMGDWSVWTSPDVDTEPEAETVCVGTIENLVADLERDNPDAVTERWFDGHKVDKA